MNTKSIPSILAVVMSVMSLIFIQSSALAHIPHCPEPDFVGLSERLENPVSMTVDDQIAYVLTDQGSSLTIIDLATTPNFTTRSKTIFDVQDAISIIKVGDLVYIVVDSQSVLIYNITDPSNPAYISSYTPQIPATSDIIINGIYMYVSSEFANQPTEIVDISDPINPALVASVTLTKPIRLFFDNFAYTGDLTVLDMTEPTAPTILTPRINPSLNADQFMIDENYLYAIENYSTSVIDITDPIRPLRIGNGIAFGTAYSPQLVGSILFGYDRFFISVTDISNPTNPLTMPSFESGLDSGYDFFGLHLFDDVIYALTNHFIVAQRLYTNPTVATQRTFAPANDIALKDNLALVTTDGGALQIFDITRPDRLVLISTFELDDNAVAIDIKDDVAFIATDRDDLNLINIADPSNPLFMSKIEVGRRARDVNIIDNLMYVVDRIDGLHIFDVTDPTDPQLISITDTVGWAQDITIDDENKIAYLAQNQFDLQIIDINDPTDPQIIGSITPLDVVNTGINTSSVQGNLLYTAEGESGYRIFDVSDPTNPIELATLETDEYDDTNFDYGFAHQISIDANRLVVANGTGGFSWYNNADPFNPTLIRHLSSESSFNFGGERSSVRRVQVKDGLAYSTVYGGGLRVYDMRLCTLCPADFDNNSILDFFDISLFLSAFLAQDPAADLTNEGIFDFFDVSVFLSFFSTGCP